MASSMMIKIAVIAFTSVFSLQCVLGALTCEELPVQVCAFSVSSSGARCVLEKSILRDGGAQYQCLTSEVMAENINEWIETEVCLNKCGLDRMAVGMSSDGLMEYSFTSKLCSPQCYNTCHNIVNLYFNLAAGEGVYLPRLCQAHRSGSRRMVQEVLNGKQSSITAESFEFASAPSASSSTMDITTAIPAASPVP
ncbi:hypothetical protein SUGI_0060290 [Cryptomeria japonica]|uniref:uncharacterized protein LOC131071667 n=1 Tax=Cryptomeria japonica TaxID=3369 RepID=UPI002408DF12|nr:uncharacterized protein LOC131071667 [Cryptomeria japonica]GLJ07171.1 hypothetical protein SUGI_0060290 [Cryptomeria japonica]